MHKNITIIGVTESADWHELTADARRALKSADIIFGAERHLKKAKSLTKAKPHTWKSPLSASLKSIETACKQGKKIAVLATGDPMFFGIGTTLTRHFGNDIKIYPAMGAFAHATSALGWRSDRCAFTTLHGRPMAQIKKHLTPRNKILILSYDSSTPAKLATFLKQQGWGKATMHVLCDLGADNQTIQKFKNISKIGKTKFSNLNTIAVELPDGMASSALLLDNELENDGQITKEEIRSITLMRLRPFKGGHLWDIGAGCGSISIGWMMFGGTALAIEKNRTKYIKSNAENWGVEESLTLLKQDIHSTNFANLQVPDAIFWGGGISSLKTLEKTYKLLKKNGIFVVNAVTLDAFATLQSFHKKHGGTISRLQIEKLESIGNHSAFKPAHAVWQFYGVKP